MLKISMPAPWELEYNPRDAQWVKARASFNPTTKTWDVEEEHEDYHEIAERFAHYVY